MTVTTHRDITIETLAGYSPAVAFEIGLATYVADTAGDARGMIDRLLDEESFVYRNVLVAPDLHDSMSFEVGGHTYSIDTDDETAMKLAVRLIVDDALDNAR